MAKSEILEESSVEMTSSEQFVRLLHMVKKRTGRFNLPLPPGASAYEILSYVLFYVAEKLNRYPNYPEGIGWRVERMTPEEAEYFRRYRQNQGRSTIPKSFITKVPSLLTRLKKSLESVESVLE